MNWDRSYELKALSDSGRNEEALDGLKELMSRAEAAQDKAAVLLLIGSCLRNLGRLDEARVSVAEAGRLVEQDSEVFAWALYGGAGLDMDQGRWEDALSKFDALLKNFAKILEREENRSYLGDIRRKRGIALLGLDRPEEARPILERAAEGNREKETVSYCLGKCYYKLGKYDQAKHWLQQALTVALDPDYQADTHYHLGLTYYRLGQAARAREQFEWCLEHGQDHGVPIDYILTGLVNASRALGLEKDVERYSKLISKP
jgi:tetratricopeptide (TPR) repeat protein